MPITIAICGYSVAAAIILHHIGETSGNTKLGIGTLGGSLKVDFNFHNDTYKNIFLEGPANYVFTGTYKI